jgi:SAM-dependent methyltransferase
MSASLIYRSATMYELLMLALYGRHYRARSRAIADLIPRRASVVDLCCGPASLYFRHLRHKEISYRGIDVNPRFIERLRRRGIPSDLRDLNDDQPFPKTDYVILQASLYHFLPAPERIVDRMLRAAQRQVIISEPVRNLVDSPIRFIASLARRQTNAGSGEQPHRFNEQTLDAFFSKYQDHLSRSFLLPGGREKVYVLNGMAPLPQSIGESYRAGGPSSACESAPNIPRSLRLQTTAPPT